MIFKCKNCEGNVIYSPEKKKMICPYCDSLDSETRSDAGKDVMTLCPSCSGEVPVLEHTAATQCPYCGNYIILNQRVEGQYEPAMIIPFKIGKEQCKSMIRDRFKKFKFAPIDFLSEVRLNGMVGEYVPYWFYDYDANVHFEGEGKKTRSWTTGDKRYTEVSIYHVVRRMNIPYRAIPADASIPMPDDIMDLMEPYQYEDLEKFHPEYLSGFKAEKYNMPAADLEVRAKQKMISSAKNLVSSSHSGYASVHTNIYDINTSNDQSKYGMLPVWKYDYTYQNKAYPFYVNGQTGKIVGECPLSKKKVVLYAASLWAFLTIALALLNGIFLV